jgi:hypothetical protein
MSSTVREYLKCLGLPPTLTFRYESYFSFNCFRGKHDQKREAGTSQDFVAGTLAEKPPTRSRDRGAQIFRSR